MKISSYNIQYGYGQDKTYDLERIVKAVEDNDIICLQEVTTNWPICQFDQQPEMMAKSLNYYYAFSSGFEMDASSKDDDGNITNRRAGFGNMVLSRWPIVYSRSHTLPRPKTSIPEYLFPPIDFPRVALETIINVDDTPIRVISVHLTHLPGVQMMAQVEFLKSLVFGLPDQLPLWENNPAIVAWTGGQPAPAVPMTTMMLGDFNFQPDSEYHKAMVAHHPKTGAGLIDAQPLVMPHGDDNMTCVNLGGSLNKLDYMFVTPCLGDKITSARVDCSITASDHFPIYFDIDI